MRTLLDVETTNMAKPATKTADVRADEIVSSIYRQMQGAANAARRAGAPLTEAGMDEKVRAALIAKLTPLWADIQAGLKGTKVAAATEGPSLLAQAKEAANGKGK